MHKCLYCKKNYKIIKCRKNSYLVINTDKEFKEGHTHVYNYKLCKLIVYACINGKFPPKQKALIHNKRMIESIVRVCSHKQYSKFKSILDNINQTSTT